VPCKEPWIFNTEELTTINALQQIDYGILCRAQRDWLKSTCRKLQRLRRAILSCESAKSGRNCHNCRTHPSCVYMRHGASPEYLFVTQMHQPKTLSKRSAKTTRERFEPSVMLYSDRQVVHREIQELRSSCKANEQPAIAN
jgi:hypothetical protein